MKKCNKCGGTWVSQATWCIHCNSEDYEDLELKKEKEDES